VENRIVIHLVSVQITDVKESGAHRILNANPRYVTTTIAQESQGATPTHNRDSDAKARIVSRIPTASQRSALGIPAVYKTTAHRMSQRGQKNATMSDAYPFKTA